MRLTESISSAFFVDGLNPGIRKCCGHVAVKSPLNSDQQGGNCRKFSKTNEQQACLDRTKSLEMVLFDQCIALCLDTTCICQNQTKYLAEKAGIKEWPKNALRHGFGSFFFALCKDENKVAAEMGNSPEIVHRHYRAVVTGAACQAYWAILPTKFEKPKKEGGRE